MPHVPVLSHSPTTPKITAPVPTATGDNLLQNGREELAKSVSQEVVSHGRVTTDFLDKFALANLNAQMPDTPLSLDYVALRYAAEKEQTNCLRAQQRQQVANEGKWTVMVGTLLPDNGSLNAYLDAQLPIQQKRFEQSGLSVQQATKQTQQIRAKTVEKHILRSLAVNDWQTAQAVLTAQGKHLATDVMSRCAQQVRHSFAKNQAQILWQEALAQQPRNPQGAKTIAWAQLQEPDENLKEDIQRELTNLWAQTQRQQALEKADLFAQLFLADSAQKSQLLATQTVLDGDAFDVACRVAQQPQQTATEEQQAWFVKNYFNTSANIEQAFSKGVCAPQDYFRLKAVEQKRAGGKEPHTQRWLCKSVETWMRKQGFSSQDIMHASYAVLGGASDEEQINIWKQLKTLLTY